MFNPYNERVIKDIAPTITTQCGSTTSSSTVWICEDKEHEEMNSSTRGVEPINAKEDGTCRTIKSQYYKTSKANFERTSTFGATGVVDNQLRIRKLTPKECWRLMGFTDEVFEKAQKVNSNSQLYKQAGNSIVVNVLAEIFQNLLLGRENELAEDNGAQIKLKI